VEACKKIEKIGSSVPKAINLIKFFDLNQLNPLFEEIKFLNLILENSCYCGSFQTFERENAS